MEPLSIGLTPLKTLKRFSDFTSDQSKGVEFLEQRDCGGLWGDVGTGKTAVLLTVLQRLIDRFAVHRTLVTGPRLVAERVWSSEVIEWAHLRGLRVSRIVGTAAQRLAAIQVDADIYTISRDNVCWLESLFIRYEGLVRKQYRVFPWDCIVADECQSYKSQSSQRTKAMFRLRRLVRRIYLATGSLLPNGYRDAWSQMYLLDGGKRLGQSEAHFLREFFRQEVNNGVPSYELKEGAAEKIDALIADLFFVMRDSQPPASTNFIKVSLSKEEKARYSKMVRTSVLDLGGQQVTAVNAGVLFGKLCQLANGALYDEEHKWHRIHDRKLDALVELLESLPRPLLIGYSFVHDIDRIRAALLAAKIPNVGVIRTNESLNAWARGEIKVGIMHPQSAGHGLNDLKDAATVVWFGLTPNLEAYQQLNGRVIGGHRRAGRNICVHHFLAEGTVDEDLKGMLDFKDGQQVHAQIRIVQKLQAQYAKSTTS